MIILDIVYLTYAVFQKFILILSLGDCHYFIYFISWATDNIKSETLQMSCWFGCLHIGLVFSESNFCFGHCHKKELVPQ